MDTQAILRQQTTLQLLIPAGHAILQGWEMRDPADALAGLYAKLGELLTQTPTRNVLCYLEQAIQHARLADAPAFDVLEVPLQVRFCDLIDAML